MRKAVLGLALGLAASAAHAQALYFGPDPVAIAQAAAQAASPQPCATIPAADTLNGVVGSGCYAPGNAARASATQRAMTSTDSAGNFALTWARAWPAQPAVTVKPIMSAQKGDCGFYTVTTTGVTGWCTMQVAVTIGGLSVTALQAVGAGVPVMLVAGAPTQ